MLSVTLVVRGWLKSNVNVNLYPFACFAVAKLKLILKLIAIINGKININMHLLNIN